MDGEEEEEEEEEEKLLHLFWLQLGTKECKHSKGTGSTELIRGSSNCYGRVTKNNNNNNRNPLKG